MKKNILFVLVSGFLFLSTSHAKEKTVEGFISEYACGDNCYLTIIDNNGKEHVGLCGADECVEWDENGMPDSLKGKKVRVTVGWGEQFNGEGDVAGEMEAFYSIKYLQDTTEPSSTEINGTNLLESDKKKNVSERMPLLEKNNAHEQFEVNRETGFMEEIKGADEVILKCLLEVNRKKYINGKCPVAIEDDIFYIGSSKNRTLPYFAILFVSENNVVDGFWNEVRGGTHAHTSLGELVRNGACWTNETAKVCIWK